MLAADKHVRRERAIAGTRRDVVAGLNHERRDLTRDDLVLEIVDRPHLW